MKALHALLPFATLVGAMNAQGQLLLPDNHHLSENLAKSTGSLNWWGTTLTGRRFMVLYEASHFLNAGVSGPIGFQQIAFRGEDAEHNIGGQTYSDVTVDVYSTTLTAATMNPTTFGANIAPPLPNTTTLHLTIGIPVMTVGASSGTCPNDYAFVLPFLVAATPFFDPTGVSGPEVNFLVDIHWTAYAPSPPPVTATIATQDTTGGVAVVRGRGIYAAAPAALVGTASTAPPVMRLTITGPGGSPALIPARVESYGAACGGAPSAVYQLFRHTENFDLQNPGQVDLLSGLRLVPDVYPAPNFYTVFGGAAPVDLLNGVTGAPDATGDDTTYMHALPGAFDFPGGSTGTIRPCTNGYIILDPANGETLGDYSATVDEFLGVAATNNYPRLAPCWHDFHAGRNLVTHPGSGLYARNVGTVCLVTWFNIGSYDTTAAGNEVHTLQAAIDTATGVVELRYGPMQQIGGDTLDDGIPGGDIVSCLVGFTRGRIGNLPSVNPQSRDLSIERPFRTRVEGLTSNVVQTAVNAPAAAPPHYEGRMFPGQVIRWNAANVPAGTLLGVQLLDVAATRPGLQLPGITAPGCMLSTSNAALFWEVFLFPGPAVAGTVPFPVPPGFSGVDLFAQFVVLDGLFGGPDLITSASNALRHTIGLQ